MFFRIILCINNVIPLFETIKRLADKNQRIIAVNLAKNFGQHAAIMAGFHYLSDDTDIICCLDDDGQTPANEIGKLIFKLDEGYDAPQSHQRPYQSFFRIYNMELQTPLSSFQHLTFVKYLSLNLIKTPNCTNNFIYIFFRKSIIQRRRQ